MALLGTITKQPREILDCDINYTAALAGRVDTILGTPVVEISPTEVNGVDVDSVVVDHPNVKLIISGGLDVTGLYKITILTTFTPTGLIFEDEINVVVEEV